jgi:sec-independent protein translocase protein TatA
MRALEPWHLLILATVFIALFGAKRLPDSARSLGEAMTIFKRSTREGLEPTTSPPAAPIAPSPLPASAQIEH